jgi:hypothetical protein
VSTMLEFICNNALVSGLIVAPVIAVAGGVWKWRHDRKDSQTIYNFLLKSKAGTDFTFRSTEAISSHTKIPERRVADLCSKHPKIRRNEEEKQSWTLVE